jgi:aspartate carbamoyltransferase catalytic subunit
MYHLVDLKDLNVNEISELIHSAEEFSSGKIIQYSNKVAANLFFEPSTRTQYSFETAEHRLGCRVITFNKEASSIKKGESFYDTVKTFSQFADVIVIRHSENNYYQNLVNHIDIPLINAGDGSGNHPTQSLLDLLTIYQEFKCFAGLKIAIVGDIAYSRVAQTMIM